MKGFDVTFRDGDFLEAISAGAMIVASHKIGFAGIGLIDFLCHLGSAKLLRADSIKFRNMKPMKMLTCSLISGFHFYHQ